MLYNVCCKSQWEIGNTVFSKHHMLLYILFTILLHIAFDKMYSFIFISIQCNNCKDIVDFTTNDNCVQSHISVITLRCRLCCTHNYNIKNDHASTYYHYHKAHICTCTLTYIKNHRCLLVASCLSFLFWHRKTSISMRQEIKVHNDCFKKTWICSQMVW